VTLLILDFRLTILDLGSNPFQSEIGFLIWDLNAAMGGIVL